MVHEEPDVMRQVVDHARLARRYLIGIIGDDVQLSEPLVVYTCGRPDFGTVLDISVTIHVCDGFSVRRVSQQFHGVGDDSFVGVGVARSSSREYGFSELLKACLRMVLYNLVDTTDDEPVSHVPL